MRHYIVPVDMGHEVELDYRSACQAMAAPTAAPIVTKLGLQTLNITSLKLIPPHLTSEAVLRPNARSKVPYYHVTQTIDGHAIGIG